MSTYCILYPYAFVAQLCSIAFKVWFPSFKPIWQKVFPISQGRPFGSTVHGLPQPFWCQKLGHVTYHEMTSQKFSATTEKRRPRMKYQGKKFT